MLQDYFRKGISYFISAIANAHPKLLPLRYYIHELTAVIDFLKEYIYLTKYAGTYA